MFRSKTSLIFLTAGLLVASSACADPAAESEKAILDTQELLMNPKQRGEIIKDSKEAQAADQTLKDLAGSPEMSAEIYALAADIFGSLAKHNPDPDALMKEVQGYQTNPQGIKLTPDQQKRLKALAEKIEKQNPALAPKLP